MTSQRSKAVAVRSAFAAVLSMGLLLAFNAFMGWHVDGFAWFFIATFWLAVANYRVRSR